MPELGAQRGLELEASLPTVIVTGFLGSGKTTLVNHLLGQRESRRVAVIANEFGALPIDSTLLAADGVPVVSLPNGCLCCATQGDLRAGLRAIRQVADQLDVVVIETSGLADPEPVERAIDACADFHVDSVVTVIDTVNFDRNLDDALPAYQQLVRADMLVVNKVDLVTTEVVEHICSGLQRLNAGAQVVTCRRGELPAEVLLGSRRRERHAGERAPAQDRAHAHDFESIVLTAGQPLDAERFEGWLAGLAPAVYRTKGFVALAGASERRTVHQVGRHCEYGGCPDTDATTRTTTELVLIGRQLSEHNLARGLNHCVAQPLAAAS